jgi:hypothetical protein
MDRKRFIDWQVAACAMASSFRTRVCACFLALWLRRILVGGLLFVAALHGVVCHAQQAILPPTPGDPEAVSEDGPAGTAQTDASEEQMEGPPKGQYQQTLDSIKPDAIYLRDESGNMVYIPNSRYEDFSQYLDRRSIPVDRNTPQYVIDQCMIDIEAVSETAELTASLRARLLDGAEEFCRIPLSMQNVSFSKSPTTNRPSQSYVLPVIQSNSAVAAPSVPSYEWVIRNSGPLEDGSVDIRSHELELNGYLKVNSTGERSSIDLSLPVTPTQIRLAIAGVNQSVQIVGGIGEILRTTNSNEGQVPPQTIVDISTNGGEIRINWQQRAEQKNLNAIDVESQTVAALDIDRQQWNLSSRLVFQSGGSLGGKAYRIQLPMDANWVDDRESSNADFDLQLVNVEDDDLKPSLMLQFSDTFNESVCDVEIESQIAVANIELEKQDFSSILISDIQKHSGRLEIRLPAAYRFGWTQASRIRLLRQSRTSDNAGGLAYSFQFESQDFRLSTLSILEQQRQSIFPVYLVEIEQPEVMTLRSVLEFPYDFSSVSNLRIQPNGWSIDSIQLYPDTSSSVAFDRDDDGSIVPRTNDLLPSSSNDNVTVRPNASRALSISAFRPTSGIAGETTSFQLPTFYFEDEAGVADGEHGSGLLYVAVSPNLNVQVQDALIDGLATDTGTSTIAEPFLEPKKNFNLSTYRFRNETTKPIWASKIRLKPQRVEVEQECKISVVESSYKSNQRWKFHVENQSLSRIRLNVPRSAIETRTDQTLAAMAVRMNGRPVSWSLVAASDSASETGFELESPTATPSADEVPDSAGSGKDRQWIEIAIEKDQNDFELETEITASLDELPEDTWLQSELLLVRLIYEPSYTSLSQAATIETGSSVRCRIPERLLLSQRQTGAVRSQELLLPIEGLDAIRCFLKEVPQTEAEPFSIEKYWMQTTLAGPDRRDRFVASVLSNSETVDIELPAGIEIDQLQIVVDGSQILAPSRPLSMTYSIRFRESDNPSKSQGSELTRHLVEIWMWSNTPQQVLSTIQPVLPVFPATSSRPEYKWEVIVASDNHLVAIDERLLPEYEWQTTWKGIRRIPTKSTRELATWIDTSLTIDPNVSQNRYVLSGYASPQGASLSFLPAYAIWFAVAAIVLVVAAALTFFRSLRNPLPLLLFCLIAVGIRGYSTDLAMLFIQAASLAVFIVLVIWFSYYVIGRRVRRRSVFARRSSTFQSPAVHRGSVSSTPPKEAPYSEKGSAIQPASTITERV